MAWRTRDEHQILDRAALSNEVLGQLHQLGYAAAPHLIVFLRHVPAPDLDPGPDGLPAPASSAERPAPGADRDE